MSDWRPISDRPPLKMQIEMRDADGTVVTGQALYDGIIGQRAYWHWDREAKPTKLTAKYQGGVLRKVEPVAWRPLKASRFDVAPEMIGRREVEVLLVRCVLTEGTYRRPGHRHLQSSTPSTSLDVENQSILETFAPERWDHDNYEVVSAWLTKLTPEQRMAVWLRAYRLSFEMIGDRLGRRSGQTARNTYAKAIQKAWSLALGDAKRLKRLPRDLWAPRKERAKHDRQAAEAS
jgi:hypothetical protein